MKCPECKAPRFFVKPYKMVGWWGTAGIVQDTHFRCSKCGAEWIHGRLSAYGAECPSRPSRDGALIAASVWAVSDRSAA
jgi:transposase-like protein